MPLSKEHKARTREKIVAAAGLLFRRAGYAEIGVDRIMAEAGLTRGGFYNHFPSKAALFAEVLGADHGLVRQLSAREGADRDTLRTQTRAIFRDYLAPAHLPEVALGCSFAALANDAARADDGARARFTEIYRRMVVEVDRATADGPTAHAALALAIGALSIARGLDDAGLRDSLLGAAADAIDGLLA